MKESSLIKISLLLLVASFVYACKSNNPKRSLIKHWKIQSIYVQNFDKMLNTLSPEEKEFTKNMMQQQVEDISYRFFADGRYELDLRYAKLKGTWRLLDAKTLLTVTYLNDSTAPSIDTNRIESLNDTCLILWQHNLDNKLVIKKLKPIL